MYGAENPANGDQTNTYIPSSLKALEVFKLTFHILTTEQRLILLKQPSASLNVINLGDGIADICLLDAIESHDDAIDLRQRVPEIPLRRARCKLDLLLELAPSSIYNR